MRHTPSTSRKASCEPIDLGGLYSLANALVCFETTHSGVAFPEVLINSTNEGGSAYVQYVYNNTAPVTVGDVTLSNYSAVYKSYDPTFPSEFKGPSLHGSCPRL